MVFGELEQMSQEDGCLLGALRRLQSMLAEPGGLEHHARFFVESLARTAAGALLRSDGPAAVADAYITSRLDGTFRHTYGSGIVHGEHRVILERALPLDVI